MFVADKNMSTTLLKTLCDKKLKNIPIICITNNDIIKKMGDIKRLCKICNLTVPTRNEVISLLKTQNKTIKNINLLYDNSNGNLEKLFYVY